MKDGTNSRRAKLHMNLADQILENEAVKRAAVSDNLTEIKTASEIQASVAPVRADKMHIAIVVGLGTLVFQIVQFGWSTWLQTRSQEDTQWRTAVQTISLEKGHKALYGVLNVETFYHSSRYRDDALKLVAESLPCLNNPDSFDQVYITMRNALPADQESLMYEINRNIAVAYGDDLESLARDSESYRQKIYETDDSGKLPELYDMLFTDRVESLRDEDVEAGPAATDPASVDVWLRRWEIDSLAGYTVRYWRDHGRDLRSRTWLRRWLPSHAVPNMGTGPNLYKTIFRLDKNQAPDMTYLDLSGFIFAGSYMGRVDLSHSSLRNANLAQADLSGAKLTGTDVRGANIDQADLSRVVIAPSDIPLWQNVCNAETARLSDASKSLLAANHLLANDASCPAALPPASN